MADAMQVDEKPTTETTTETKQQKVVTRKVVLPGDVIADLNDNQNLRFGPGLIQNKDNIVSTKAGVLQFKPPGKFWVDGTQKRYVPWIEDMVIGIVVSRHAESYKVDIGAAALATLPLLAFEGATRKNRPNLQVNSLVYARVVVANKDMEPELVCFAANNKQEGYGELVGGYNFKVSTGLARSLLAPNCPVLAALGKRIPYEIAVGMNGRVWVNSGSVTNTIVITNALQNSEYLPTVQIENMVSLLFQRIK